MDNEYATLKQQVQHLKSANKLHRQQIALNRALINELEARMKVLEEDEDNCDNELIRQLLEQGRRLLKLYNKAIDKRRCYRHCLHVYEMYQLKHGEDYIL